MKLLVATDQTQGQVPGDYDFCVAGELLWITEVCGRDRSDPAQGCGCGRGFGGLTSHRATTTAEVVERPFTTRDLRLAIRTSLADQGWLSDRVSLADRTAIVDAVIADVQELIEELPVGAVLRRNVDDFHAYWPRAQR